MLLDRSPLQCSEPSFLLDITDLEQGVGDSGAKEEQHSLSVEDSQEGLFLGEASVGEVGFPWTLTGWLIRNKRCHAWLSVRALHRPPRPHVPGCEEGTHVLCPFLLLKGSRGPRGAHTAPWPRGRLRRRFPSWRRLCLSPQQTMPSCGSYCSLGGRIQVKLAASIPQLVSRPLCPAQVLT